MRGNQEAFILVKIKDGRQYVCALNRLKNVPDGKSQLAKDGRKINLEKDVIWH